MVLCSILNTKKDTKPFLEDIEDTLPKKEIKKIIAETKIS
jgi:hypothetical protein